jgi:hypothetical protein
MPMAIKPIEGRIEGFVFYTSFWESITEMYNALREQGVKFDWQTVLTQIVHYGAYGALHDTMLLGPTEMAFFNQCKKQLDASRYAYITGKKGGRPKKE